MPDKLCHSDVINVDDVTRYRLHASPRAQTEAGGAENAKPNISANLNYFGIKMFHVF